MCGREAVFAALPSRRGGEWMTLLMDRVRSYRTTEAAAEGKLYVMNDQYVCYTFKYTARCEFIEKERRNRLGNNNNKKRADKKETFH